MLCSSIALAIALELTLAETEDLLKRAGFALSRSQKADVIIEYFLVNRMFDIFEILRITDERLIKLGLSEKYKNEIEFLYIEQLLLYGAFRFYKSKFSNELMLHSLIVMKNKFNVEVDSFYVGDMEQDAYSLDKLAPIEYIHLGQLTVDKRVKDVNYTEIPVYTCSTVSQLYQNMIEKLGEYDEFQSL